MCRPPRAPRARRRFAAASWALAPWVAGPWAATAAGCGADANHRTVAAPARPAGEPHATPRFACGGPQQVGTVAEDLVRETSGLVASSTRDDLFFLHNDSGDEARLFAIDGSGRAVAELRLEGATAFDWEGLALGPGDDGARALYIGDFGDNHHVRASVTVVRIPEPDLPGPAGVVELPAEDVESAALVFPDGEHPDTEALLVDHDTGDLYVITKDRSRPPRVFGVAAPRFAGEAPLPLVLRGELGLPPTVASRLVTDAALSPTGDAILVRTYDDALLYRRRPGEPIPAALAREPIAVPVAPERQGEAITFLRDGLGYLTISEGDHPAMWRVSLCDTPTTAGGD